MTHANDALWGGISALDAIQIPEMRLQQHFATARFQRTHAKNMLGKPCRGPRGPSMTEAMAKPFITVVPVFRVDIMPSFRDQLIDSAGIFGPTQIEIFPETRRPEVKHLLPSNGE